MTYRIPDTLKTLRDWLKRKGATEFYSERQAAFMAQSLLGTRFKFPPKGKSCFPLLQKMEKAILTGRATSERGAEMSTTVDKSTGSNVNHGTQTGGLKRPERREKRLGSLSSNDSKDVTHGAQIPKRTHGSEIPPFDGITTAEAGLVIFCDGACEPNPGAGGWGFVVYRDGAEIHADCGGSEATTNNIMEMTGALMALRWFAERGVVEPVRLLCDSRYVVDGCNVWRHGWKKKGWRRKGPAASDEKAAIANLELWQELDEALTLVPITLEWVKGHAGILGNERADELSLIGRERALTTELSPIEAQLQYAAV